MGGLVYVMLIFLKPYCLSQIIMLYFVYIFHPLNITNFMEYNTLIYIMKYNNIFVDLALLSIFVGK